MELEDIRKEIAEIDREMAELFVKRMEAVRGVAEYKLERGLRVEDRAQEQRVIEARSEAIKDSELRRYYVQFIRSTMDISKRWQHRLMDGQRISCCGSESDAALISSVFPDGIPVQYPDAEAAFKAVSDGDCDAALLPFEKSYVGESGQVLDMMFSGDLHVNGMYDVTEESGQTRYVVLSRTENEILTAGAESSFLLMFTVRDEVGALAKAINTISVFGFNMRIMRSRPMPDIPWNYYFYAEAEGNDLSENGRRMINALSAVCPIVKVVGRYSTSSETAGKRSR